MRPRPPLKPPPRAWPWFWLTCLGAAVVFGAWIYAGAMEAMRASE